MKKITIFFSALLLFLIFFVGSCYAAAPELPALEYLYYRDENGYSQYPDEYYYFMYLDKDGSTIKLTAVASKNYNELYTIRAFVGGSGVVCIEQMNKEATEKYFYIKHYELENGEWVGKTYSNVLSPGSTSFEYGEMYYSNVDIYSSSTGDEIFFQQPPQEQAITLAPIVEELETEKTLEGIVAILPVVLVVIVGLLAMRKAIAFLMKTLKQG